MLLCHTAAGQTQLRKWYIAPKQVYMPPGVAPSVTALPTVNGTVPATAGNVANGMYDNAGNLLFYVADGGVYDYNNTLMGNINTGGPEVVIVPFGNNSCLQKKFNIFTTKGGVTTPTGIYRAVVDMFSFSVDAPTAPIDQIANPTGGAMTEFGALAIGNVNGSGDRYLYWMAGSGFPHITASGDGLIKRITVFNNGSVSAGTTIFPSPALSLGNDGAKIFAKELDLSPDGRWLAWSSYHEPKARNAVTR